MQHLSRARLHLVLLLFLGPLLARATPYLVPGGTLLHCRAGEKISSKNLDVGDPVVCQVGRAAGFPYGTNLTGHFEDYKDPGHFVGKGWMELVFDRVLLADSQSLQVSTKVVDVRGFRTDNQGRILGKGHTVRDIVKWTIPVLWPLDLLTLPLRGPRPTIKAEREMTVKLMDDLMLDPHAVPYRQPMTMLEEPRPQPGMLPAQAPAVVVYNNVVATPPAIVYSEPNYPIAGPPVCGMMAAPNGGPPIYDCLPSNWRQRGVLYWAPR